MKQNAKCSKKNKKIARKSKTNKNKNKRYIRSKKNKTTKKILTGGWDETNEADFQRYIHETYMSNLGKFIEKINTDLLSNIKKNLSKSLQI